MILVKNWKTVNCFLLDKIVKRNVFGNVSNDKPPTLNYKSWFLKGRKDRKFSKGLTDEFGPKLKKL